MTQICIFLYNTFKLVSENTKLSLYFGFYCISEKVPIFVEMLFVYNRYSTCIRLCSIKCDLFLSYHHHCFVIGPVLLTGGVLFSMSHFTGSEICYDASLFYCLCFRSLFLLSYHFWILWRWATANTRTPTTTWCMLLMSHRPSITCSSRLAWW